MADDAPLRLTLRFGQRLADISLPPQCQLIQEPHFWAALEFDPLQIQYLQITGLKSLDNQRLIPMCRFRVEADRLVRVFIEDEELDNNGLLLTGIPVSSIASQGVMFDVVTEDVRERIVHRLSDEDQAGARAVWSIVSPNGEDRVAMEVARARLRQHQMEIALDSTRANLMHRQIIEQLLHFQSTHEMQLWESLDIQRCGFLSFHNLLLGVAQSEYTFGNISEQNEEETVQRTEEQRHAATQTSDVSDSSDDEDSEDDTNNDGDVLNRIRRQVTSVTIHKKRLLWRKRTSSRLMLLHSSPDGYSHALWLKKPNATWLKCETLPVSDIVAVVSGSAKFPETSDRNSKSIQRRGLSIQIQTTDSCEWVHMSLRRSRIRNSWVAALESLIAHRQDSSYIS